MTNQPPEWRPLVSLTCPACKGLLTPRLPDVGDQACCSACKTPLLAIKQRGQLYLICDPKPTARA